MKRIAKKLKHIYARRIWSSEKYARSLGVKVGIGCYISTKKFPSEAYLIEIGNYCRIAPSVSFFTHGGLWSQRIKHGNFDFFGKIKVGNHTYIGEGAKIMPGVTIGNDVIIGAGSVVTKSIPSGSIAAGNPARIVGNTEDFIKKAIRYDVKTKDLNYEEKKSVLLSLPDDKFIQK